MTDQQFDALNARLARIEANQELTVEGLRLVCQELGIRERLATIVEKLGANGRHATEPAPPPDGEGI